MVLSVFIIIICVLVQATGTVAWELAVLQTLEIDFDVIVKEVAEQLNHFLTANLQAKKQWLNMGFRDFLKEGAI